MHEIRDVMVAEQQDDLPSPGFGQYHEGEPFPPDRIMPVFDMQSSHIIASRTIRSASRSTNIPDEGGSPFAMQVAGRQGCSSRPPPSGRITVLSDVATDTGRTGQNMPVLTSGVRTSSAVSVPAARVHDPDGRLRIKPGSMTRKDADQPGRVHASITAVSRGASSPRWRRASRDARQGEQEDDA